MSVDCTVALAGKKTLKTETLGESKREVNKAEISTKVVILVYNKFADCPVL